MNLSQLLHQKCQPTVLLQRSPPQLNLSTTASKVSAYWTTSKISRSTKLISTTGSLLHCFKDLELLSWITQNILFPNNSNFSCKNCHMSQTGVCWLMKQFQLNLH
jgi:hypothetical protein